MLLKLNVPFLLFNLKKKKKIKAPLNLGEYSNLGVRTVFNKEKKKAKNKRKKAQCFVLSNKMKMVMSQTICRFVDVKTSNYQR